MLKSPSSSSHALPGNRPRCRRYVASRAWRSLGLMLAAIFAAGLAVRPTSGQETLRSTWEALPERVLFAAQIPSGNALAAKLREETRLGALLFSDKRLELASKAFREIATGRDENGGAMGETLARYGLADAPWEELLAGACGMAIAAPEEGTWTRDAYLVMWLTPGGELGGQLWEAIQGGLLDQEEDEPVERVDLSLAGYPVIQLTTTLESVESTVDFELPDDYYELPEDEQDLLYEQAYQAYEAGLVEVESYRTLLLTRLEGRLVGVLALEEVEEEQRADQTDQLQEELASLIEAHLESRDGFAPRLAQGRLPEYEVAERDVSLLEAVGDIAALTDLMREGFNDEELDEMFEGIAAISESVMKLLGIDQLGLFRVHVALEQNALRMRAFVEAPAPRGGLLRIADQTALPIEVPNWVPASAVSFAQLSCDLAAVYRMVKEEVTTAFPDQADQGFQMGETQALAFLGVSPEDMLAALGTRHVSFSLPPEALTLSTGALEIKEAMERAALVWQLKDEALWRNLVQKIGSAGMALGGQGIRFRETDEQGFRGYRVTVGEAGGGADAGLEGGIVVGKGYLVLAYGKKVLETTLAVLNNPPPQGEGLRDSELLRKSLALSDASPAVSFEVTDGDAMFRFLRNTLALVLDEELDGESEDDDDDDETEDDDYEDAEEEDSAERELAIQRLFREALRELMPTEAETRGMLGAAFTSFRVEDDGFHFESVSELPAP